MSCEQNKMFNQRAMDTVQSKGVGGGGGGGGGGGDRYNYNDLVHENRVTTEFDLAPTRVSYAACLSCYTPYW